MLAGLGAGLAKGSELVEREVLQLVDEKRDTDASLLCCGGKVEEEIGEVRLEVTGVCPTTGGVDLDADGEPSRLASRG